MRPAPTFPLISLAIASTLALGCSSDDADPTVEPGVAHEGGGIEPGTAQPAGSGNPQYPAGPYGHDIGTVIQNFKFVGFRNPTASGYVADATTIETIELSEFYNPDSDPEKPLVLLINASARWCSVCQQEAQTSMGHYEYWNPKGVEFLTAIFEDADSNSAELVDIEYWSARFGLTYPSSSIQS